MAYTDILLLDSGSQFLFASCSGVHGTVALFLMIIIAIIILLVVNLLHFWKHLRCQCCNDRNHNDFGTYPFIFFVFSIVQMTFSLYLSLLCIYHIWFDLEYETIPLLLLYPFGTKHELQLIHFDFELKLNSIEYLTVTHSLNLLSMANVFILFIIYIMEGFMNWYRYYTVYIANMYLTNYTFYKILKYYVIYIMLFMVLMVLSVLLHHYIAVLIAISHFSFNIYCSIQQIRILEVSTKQSFAEKHFKTMMAPLYPTRMYAILSTVSSTLFMLLFITIDLSVAILYYPLFSSLTTFSLGLIFVRNRYFLCKCCDYRKQDRQLDVVLDRGNGAHTNKKRRWCCGRPSTHATPTLHINKISTVSIETLQTDTTIQNMVMETIKRNKVTNKPRPSINPAFVDRSHLDKILNLKVNTTCTAAEESNVDGSNHIVLPLSKNETDMNVIIAKLNQSLQQQLPQPQTELTDTTCAIKATNTLYSVEEHSGDTSVDMDERAEDLHVSIDDDDDLFRYENMPSPTEIMQNNSSENSPHPFDHIDLPSQRPNTDKAQQGDKTESFWNTNTTKHTKNVTAVQLDGGSMTSSQNRLDFLDLEQHLSLLRIVKCQGLINPLELLKSHQRRSIGNADDVVVRRSRSRNIFYE
eukprot:83130_1